MAVARFEIWLRSDWQATMMPVGMWVMRTAESVVLTCWPPGSAGAEGVHPQVGIADLDVDIVLFDLGEGVHRCKGGVAAGVAVKGGDAHQAVNAGFGLEVAVGVFTADVEGG